MGPKCVPAAAHRRFFEDVGLGYIQCVYVSARPWSCQSLFGKHHGTGYWGRKTGAMAFHRMHISPDTYVITWGLRTDVLLSTLLDWNLRCRRSQATKYHKI